MATASAMILRGLQMTGEKAIGGTLSSGEQSAYLDVLNAMIESWSLERLYCPHLLQESFALSASTVAYTIGSSATFNTTRPTKIVDPCFIRDASDYDYPLQIIGDDAYGKLFYKSSGVTYPEYLHYDHAYSSGVGTIHVYPAPAASLTLFINSWKQLQSFSTVTHAPTLPTGYQRAIESNFAIEAGAGQRELPKEVLGIASQSKSAIKGFNLPDPHLRLDPGVLGRLHSRILTGP